MKISKAIFRFFMYKVFYKVEVIGYENIKDIDNIVLSPNHTTWQDGLFIWALKGKRVHAMAKAELFKNPISRIFFKSIDMFPIERGGKDFKSVFHAVNIVEKGKTVAIFPEGTRNAREKGIKPKVGAVYVASKAGGYNVPVYITPHQKTFQKVRIIIGKPIKFEFKEGDKESLRNNTDILMKKVYDLEKKDK